MKDKLLNKILLGWSEPNLLTYILWLLSFVYRVIMAIRRFFYHRKWFHVYTAPVPVLVVGNISVGGTGKTPLTMAIVKKARQEGLNPGVISRGYGGQALQWPQDVTAETSAHYVGDEAVLIAQNAQCPVVVGPKRADAIERLLSQHDCDLIISDDGLQHYALHRDAEIAVVDNQRRHLNRFCLPAGPLREPGKRLKAVDQVFYHVAPQDDSDDETDDQQSFQQAQQNFFRLSDQGFRTVSQHESKELTPTQTIHAVAGIGHPLRFFRQLRALGFEVIEHSFPDHHRYSQEDFDFVEDNDVVVMTAKDAVKCAAIAKSNWYYLAVEVEFNQMASQALDELFSKFNSEKASVDSLT